MTHNADALRINIQELDEAIRCARICMRTGDRRQDEFLADYLRLIRTVHELQQALQAESNIAQPICMAFMPMPINPGFVGLSPEQKFAREWAIPAPRRAMAKAA